MKTRQEPFALVQPRYSLRPYQKRAVDETVAALRTHGRVLLHAPTGAGKTRMAMSVVSRWLREREAEMILWLAPTKELVAQAANDFKSAWQHHGDVEAAVIQWHGGGERFEHGTTIRRNTMLVAGLQMAGQRVSADAWIDRSLRKRVGLVVFDEAHHSVAPSYRDLVEHIVTADVSRRPLLGLSATPGRADPDESKALADMYHGHKVGIGPGGNPVRYLVSERYLARATIITHPFDGSILPQTGGSDYPSTALSSLGDDDARNRRIVEIADELFQNGHQRVIVFTPSIESAEKCVAMMKSLGHDRSFAISGRTPDEQRAHFIGTFSAPIADLPSPQAIFNCNVLTAGFDAPEISAAVIGKPTKSAVRLQQMIGRALRGPKSGGSEEAEIRMLVDASYIDFGNLADLFCEWDSLWDPD